MKDPEYTRVTYDLTVDFARTLSGFIRFYSLHFPVTS